MKAPLILVVSERMNTNRKQDRNEDTLIRIGSKARANLGLTNDKVVELWPDNADDGDRINRNRTLSIFNAYSSDLKELKKSKMLTEDYLRVGFVTRRTFDYICKDNRGKSKESSIWISDSIEDTVVGADPEFLLQVEEGVFKYASEVHGFSHSAKLGSDGPWAELRPDPAISVNKFIKNIKKLLCEHPNKECIEEYGWISGCFYEGLRHNDRVRTWPIGGHIHLGTPATIANVLHKHDNRTLSHSMYCCLKKVLDELVAIPFMKVEGYDLSTKRRHEYGTYGDVRTDHGRLEYRTLSGEWLGHPEMAKCVIGTVKAIGHEFFKILEDKGLSEDIVNTGGNIHLLDRNFDEWDGVPIVAEFGATKSSADMIDILHGNKQYRITKNRIQKLREKLTRLSTYRNYSKYLDRFFELISLPTDELRGLNKNLKETWVGNEKFIF